MHPMMPLRLLKPMCCRPIDTVAAITDPPNMEGSLVKKDSAEYAKLHSYDDYPDPILDSLKRAADKLRKGKLI